ncbi:hypothetical protein OG413_24925 [Streptomyces sp. NBC_01433]|uniref:hypothetical protein n=1 Tax=Streptomyces sp. NBC_01433 TaxID=2903864 RepID=UPI002255F1AA|nr:hypothetical protein [Streptomyces sp. NBC_01433]MCX4678510.1 hypothetical protein [Streptomyces sp. NBC_01433]
MIDPNGVRINPLVHPGSGSGGGLPRTSTEQDGEPGTIFWQRARRWLSTESGCTGPVDGAMGPDSWRGVARFLNQDRWD